ncbi:AAA-domain-containing protein [Ascobolus immersus RN42]|uniref:AAA-domain-containing protein n=1 Tax=Ascobolus immersus RN42 TaxID=1160509 RepID=A0A3N4HRX2_ASCIM|nr:AAA-domain-containing protein [Ascobolus immersus RN42]
MTDHSFVRFTGISAPETPSPAEAKPKKKASSKSSPPPEAAPEIKPPSPQFTEGALLKASGVTFTSIGGLRPQILSLRKLLLATLKRSSKFTKFGLTPPRGILLYGPPGTGKTMLIKACAAEIHATPYVISGSIVGKYMGESEAALRKVFKEARENQPAIIFIDEIDSLVPKRSGADSSEGRIVSTLIMELDSLAAAANAEDEEPKEGEEKKKTTGNQVVIVAATNRPNNIDPALRRPGRFDRELEIGIPDVDARGEILELLLKKVPCKFTEEAYIKNIASRTHGFVGADLESLVRGAVMVAMSRLEEQEDLDVDIEQDLDEEEGDDEDIGVTEADFEAALKDVRPTAMREIFLETPKVRWSDIGGQEEVKQRLRETVEWPLSHPEEFTRLGATPRKGLLLYGPPGCSKTLTAKALATEAGLNFMAVKGPELFSMYVGESERAVREVFRKARAASPSIIFFDEIDALSGTREGGGKSGSGVGSSVLAALLNEMDGIEQLKSVTVLAATNRPDMIDPALLRPGRLDTLLYIPPPSREARRQILEIQSRKIKFSPEIDFEELAERTEGYSGAEIVNICNEAVLIALRKGWREGEDGKGRFEVEHVGVQEFEEALRGQMRGITEEMKRRYVEWGAARGN